MPQRARLRALLVEDNLVNQKVASRLLEKHGCCVQTATNAREAVSLYTEYPIRSLEEKNGKRTEIIALTANAMSADRDRCLASGMDDCMSKPIALEVSTLRELISKYGTAATGPLADQPDSAHSPESLANR